MQEVIPYLEVLAFATAVYFLIALLAGLVLRRRRRQLQQQTMSATPPRTFQHPHWSDDEGQGRDH